MITCDVVNLAKEKVGDVELKDAIFNCPIKPHLLHDAVRWQLAKRRSGTATTKNRSAVRGGGKKPWRQKGTGRARAGTIRSPLWRGGGVIFGPHLRDFSFSLPKKVRRGALRSALSLRYHEGQFTLLDDFQLPGIKTKDFVAVMEHLGITSALIVIDGENHNLKRSARNIPWVKVISHEGLNVYDILSFEHLVMVRSAKEKIEKRLET